MTRYFSLLLVCALSTVFSTAQTPISIEDIWAKYKFQPRSAAGFDFMNDGVHFLKVDANQQTGNVSLNSYSIADGKMGETLLTANDIKGMWDSYKLSPNEREILYSQDEQPLYRHSSIANYYIYNIKNKTVKALSGGGKQRIASYNEQGDKIAFIRNNNLFYKDLSTDKEVQITTDGKANAVINGAPDWVYEEEFSMNTAYAWSPDGKQIAFLRFDESAVPQVTLTLYNKGLYPDYSSYKYPKAGEKNAIVSAHIYNVGTGKSTEAALPAEVTAQDFYIPKIKWTNDNQLCVVTLNRHQNDLKAYLVAPATGKATWLFGEKNDTYIDLSPGTDIADNMKFLQDNKQFVWLSEQDGYNHIYLYDIKAAKLTQLTKGKWDVTKVYGVDEKRGLIYYQAAKEKAYNRGIYAISLDGKKDKTIASEDGWNDAEFSKTFDYFVLNNSSLNQPPKIAVYDANGKKQRDLEDNARLSGMVQDMKLPRAEFFDFKTSEDVTLNGWMIKPANFDKTKKYPVLMHVYGGPNSQEADNRWDAYNYWWHQHLAQAGYIVVTIDGRGTAARGADFKKCTYKQLGKLELNDQIEGAKWLGNQPFVDKSRIGIWGWSFGGYLSLLCILKGSEVFKTAIAVAPVTNWKWYDSIYTERFLQTPQENEKGYEENSPVNFASRLKGNLLLIHGDADDNVHYQNSAEMAAALIEANKQFDTYVYPNKNHGIYGGATRLHLYTKMTNFLKEKL